MKALMIAVLIGLFAIGCASRNCLCVDELIKSNTRQLELLAELDKLKTEMYKLDR